MIEKRNFILVNLHGIPNIFLMVIMILVSYVNLVDQDIQNGYGWHSELGITDERAAELVRINPNDPTIAGWLDATQFLLQTAKEGCLDKQPTPEFEQNCLKGLKLIYEECLAHQFMSIVLCEDERIKDTLVRSGLLTNMTNRT